MSSIEKIGILLRDYGSTFLRGVAATLILAIVGTLVGLIIGIFFALLRNLTIKDTDNKYFVSNKGGFKILKDGKYIYPKGCLKKTSIVYRVVINGKATNRSLAQLVLNTFNDTNFTGRVIYKNGNFKDCSLNNLEWWEKGVSKTC